MATDTLQLIPDPILLLSRDLKQSVSTLSDREARYLVDTYYIIQDDRKREFSQVRELSTNQEPHEVILWLAKNSKRFESNIKNALFAYADSRPIGKWAMGIYGIGPVISAGLAAYIDMDATPKFSSLQRFAGLDPSCTWEKGEKRPWNAGLKTLCVRPDQRVTTKRGHVPISDVMVGDEVLTHRGYWRKVQCVYTNLYEGKLYGLRASNSGNQVAWLTAGHPVYAAPVETWASGRTHKPNECTRQPFGWHAVENVSPRWQLLRPVVERVRADIPSLKLVGVEEGALVAAAGRWPGVPHPLANRVRKEIELTADALHEEGNGACRVHVNERSDVTPAARTTLITDYSGPVYNLEVEEDHSYVVEGYAIHNCWKIGESFVKQSNRPADIYGKVYQEWKLEYIRRNEAGMYAGQAAEILQKKSFSRDTVAKSYYERGLLPPDHVHSRAKRKATVLFLSHWWEVAYNYHFGGPPPFKPWVIDLGGHKDYIPPPNFP